MDDQKLRAEIERMEYEKPRLVIWTQRDEERLRAYRELELLRKMLRRKMSIEGVDEEKFQKS